MSQNPILLCAGGTGGHLFPAEALSHALQKRGARRGVAALCIGGGEATAVALELT